MSGEDILGEAYVRLRSLVDGTFEGDARASILPAVERIAGDAALLWAGKKIFDVGKEGIDRLGELQKTEAQTEARLEATGNAAGITADQVQLLAKQMQDLSGVDHEQVAAAENVVLMFGNIKNAAGQGNDVFNQTTKAALDLSVALGTDVASAATTLGQVLEDPEQGMQRLRRAHVVLTDAQKQSIKAFQEQGDVMSAQKVVLAAVEAQVGSAAEKYGQTLPAQIARAQTAEKDAKAELVGGFAPAIELGANLTVKFADSLAALPAPARDAAGAVVLLGGGVLSLARPVSDIVRLFDRFVLSSRASTTAQEAETVVAEQNAAAKELAVGSTEHLAAVEAAFAAETEAASLSVAASLGPIGLLAVAAGALVAALTLTSGGEHNAAVDAADFTQALKDQSGVLDINIDKVSAHSLAQDSGARAAADAGVSYQSMFDTIRSGNDDLSRLGDAAKNFTSVSGIATEKSGSLADALRAAGGDSTAFGRSLISAAESGKLNAQQVADVINVVEGLTGKYRDQKTASDAEASAQTSLGDATAVTTTTFEEQAKALASLEQQKQKAVDSVRALYDAQRGEQAAEKNVQDALRGVETATNRVTAAQNALTKARERASASDLEKANLDISDANLRVGDSLDAVTKAQRDLDVARQRGNAFDIGEAERKLAEANNSHERAVLAVGDAEKSLQDLQKKGTDQDQQVIDAKQNLATAEQSVADAKNKVIDAQLGERDAAEKLLKAQEELGGGTQSAKEKLDDEIATLKSLVTAVDPGTRDGKILNDYLNKLLLIQAGGGGQVIVQLPDGTFTTEADTAARNVVHRAGGGPVRAGQGFEFGELGDELMLLHGHGRGVAPRDGTVISADVTSQLLGGSAGNHYYNVNIYNPVPERSSESTRRELRRIELLV